jgi:hypothetical protein
LAPVLDSQAAINGWATTATSLLGVATEVDLYPAIENQAQLGIAAGTALVAGIATHSANKGFQKVRWCSEVRYTEAASRRTGGQPGRRVREDESESEASADDLAKMPQADSDEPRNDDRSNTRNAGRSEDDEASEPTERDAEESEGREAGSTDAPDADQPSAPPSESEQGGDEKCREAGSTICSDDTDCLGDDVCDPDAQRCVPEACVDGTP